MKFKKEPTRFCPKEHDKDIVGRTACNGCKLCAKLGQRKDPTKDSRLKQFCSKGHDTFVCGRDKWGVCVGCVRIDPTKDSRIKNVCPDGHDISVVGRVSKGKGRCKQCVKEYDAIRKKKLGQEHPEILADRARRSYDKYKAKRIATGNVWRHKNPEKVHFSDKKSQIKRKYGLSWEEYQNLIKKQDNKCAICLRNFIELKQTPHIDHDHATGKVRGILCRTCNSALGHLKDNILLFERAIVYLRKFQ